MFAIALLAAVIWFLWQASTVAFVAFVLAAGWFLYEVSR
jgi:EamA domain-containing membrane protein RarD